MFFFNFIRKIQKIISFQSYYWLIQSIYLFPQNNQKIEMI
jgi:hypothetical protein